MYQDIKPEPDNKTGKHLTHPEDAEVLIFLKKIDDQTVSSLRIVKNFRMKDADRIVFENFGGHILTWKSGVMTCQYADEARQFLVEVGIFDTEKLVSQALEQLKN